MDIAVVLNAHSCNPNIIDTLQSIFAYMTKKVVVVVDGASWEKFKEFELPASKIEGFYHNASKSPYRNVALGLYTITEKWKDADWYCYMEYDALIASDRFMFNLQMAKESNIWMLGNDGRVDDKKMPLVESLIGEPIEGCYYLIGCCQFFSNTFMNRLRSINFFERFLNLTNSFSGGYFPNYDGYDISEHMYPTLARHLGGNVGVFANWKDNEWHGAYKYFPVRWKPDLDFETEHFPEASIIHPLKSFDHPIRAYHRELRNKKESLIANYEKELFDE